MTEPRWKRYELDITPEMIQGVERYNALTTTGNLVDDRGRFWSQERPDDYFPALRAGLQVQWTYSKFCNFTCTHCFNGSSPQWRGTEADPFLVADRLLEDPPYNVCLCGGEPLTWKPIYDIIEKLRKGGLPLVSTVTNAYLATPDNLQRLRDVGLTHLQISVDAVTPEQFQDLRVKEDGLEKCIEAVKAAVAIGWDDFSVSFTPTRNNIDDWPDFCRFYADLGVTHIRTQPYMPIGRGKDMFELMPTDDQYLRFHMNTNALVEELAPVFVDWGDPLEHMWYYTRTAAHPWQIGIQVDGWYELSCYIPVLVGDSAKHSMSELFDKDLKRLWNAPIVKQFAQRMTTMRGMAELLLPIYDEEALHIDVFDDEQLEAFLTTDDLSVLRKVSAKNLPPSYTHK